MSVSQTVVILRVGTLLVHAGAEKFCVSKTSLILQFLQSIKEWVGVAEWLKW